MKIRQIVEAFPNSLKHISEILMKGEKISELEFFMKHGMLFVGCKDGVFRWSESQGLWELEHRKNRVES